MLATLLTLVLAFPMAWIIAKIARGRAGSLLFIVCLIPFWVSETVRTLGWMILLRESGRIARPAGEARDHGGAGRTAVPRLRPSWSAWSTPRCCSWSCPLVSSLESLDNALIEAAYDLGAGGFAILRTIVIPHAAPGITAGCIIVFMLTLGNYLTPTLLGGKNSQWFTEQIYTQFITRFNWEQGAAFGFLLLGAVHRDGDAGPQARRPALRRRDAADMIPSLPRPAWLRTATAVYVVGVSRVPVPAADRGRRIRVQRCALSGAAVARIHLRLVLGNAPSGPHRPVRRRRIAGQHLDQLHRRRCGSRCSRCSLGTANAFLLERGALSRQAGCFPC